MDNEYLLNFLKEKNVATIKKKKHTYLTYYGLEQQDTYVLKDGVVKTSVILPDGREFNISYINTPDILSLLRDQVSQYTSAPFNVRIESDVATFYRIPRVLFWDYVSQDKELQDYVNSYYREKLSEAIFRQQIMMMNGKIILDIQGEEKKKLTVKQLLDKFEEASGEEFSNDSAILGQKFIIWFLETAADWFTI